MTSAEPKRDAAGRFRPGHGGRPKGSKNKRKGYTADEFRRSVAMEASHLIAASRSLFVRAMYDFMKRSTRSSFERGLGWPDVHYLATRHQRPLPDSQDLTRMLQSQPALPPFAASANSEAA